VRSQGVNMAKHKMTQKDASRIQSSADKGGKNEGFKGRAQAAVAKNEGKK